LNSDARNYWDDGRGPILFRYFVLSYSLAGLGWLSNPNNFLWLFPSMKNNETYESLFLLVIFTLPLVWLLVVISGIKMGNVLVERHSAADVFPPLWT
jgi:hypothetical protein